MHFASRDYDKWHHSWGRKTAKACKRLSSTGAAKKKAFVLFPFIRVVFSPRCNAICTMRKWSRWAGPRKTARRQIWAAGFKTPRKGPAPACLLPPHQAGRAGWGLLRRLQYCQTGRADSADYDGVRPWAVDQEQAAQLWEETERQIAAL